MVLKMEDKELIRRLVNIQGLSQREVNRRFGWSRDSIADAIRNLAFTYFKHLGLDR